MKSKLLPRLFGKRTPERYYPMRSLQKEMNDLFDSFLTGFPANFEDMMRLPFQGTSEFCPQIDLKETETDLVIAAELPGIREPDVQVAVRGDVLSIKGEKRSEQESQHLGYHQIESTYGSFERSLVLPCDVDVDRTVATVKDGVLTVLLPKLTTARTEIRQIPIKKQ